MENIWDVIVVGGGSAGLSAALMLGRSRRHTLVVDTQQPRNRFAQHMHGVLGHEGINPSTLTQQGRSETAHYGVTFLADQVRQISSVEEGVELHLASGAHHRSRAVIVASGLSDDLPAIPGLAERWGRSVLHCPYCHGWEVRDQRLGVLMTSPLGLHQAELIRQWSDQLTVFTAGGGELTPETRQRLAARGIHLVAHPVVEVSGGIDGDLMIRTADGAEFELDALFTAATLRPHDEFLTSLNLKRAENPMGSFIEVDVTGKTSHPRIWAAGNVVNPGANVVQAMAAGTTAGAVVNMTLVTEDFDRAQAAVWPEVAPAEYWEERYAGTEQVWSGRPNQSLVDTVAGFTPGRALDLGCGEGADVIWLAQQGWNATGVDISSTAIERATHAAKELGIADDRIRFLVSDLSNLHELTDATEYDLVTASFLHSPVALKREEILRQAALQVKSGGALLIISHAAHPPWSDAAKRESGQNHAHHFLSPEEQISSLALDEAEWTVELAETRSRRVASPTGEDAVLDDTIVLLRRS